MRVFTTLCALALLACAPCHADELRRAGFLGIQIAPHPKGIAIRSIAEGGTARQSGLEENDVITAINGAPPGDVGQFVATVSKLRAGDVVAIDFLRNDAPGSVKATIRPRPYESGPNADTRYLSLEVNGVRRRLIVTVPRTPGRHPAILYMTGIGCFSQESVGLESTESKLLYGLTQAGFVTMRVEKSGIGDSEGVPCSAPAYDFSTELSGYVAGLFTLRGYDFVDPQRVFLVGLSIGGVQAPLVARHAPVKGIVVINTTARPFLDYMHEVRRRQMVLRGVAYDEVEDRLVASDRCNRELLIEKKDPEAVLARDASCADFINYPAPPAYMRQWTTIVPAKEWKAIEAPVLVVGGEMDFVALAGDAQYLRDMIESFRPGHATLAVIPKMTHAMSHVETMTESLAMGDAPFETRLLDTVAAWLQRTAAS